MNCKDFQEIVDSYLSDELLTETNHDMMRHMEACDSCRNVIELRRVFRTRLKMAILDSESYRLDENFNHRMMTRLRAENAESNAATARSWFGFRTIAFAASFLIVAVIGFGIYANFGPGKSSIFAGSTPPYMVSGFAETSLVNIAAGDHQHCAVEHGYTKDSAKPTTISPMFSGLENVVEVGVGSVLKGEKLIESHACKYKGVQFAHYVMQGNDSLISVLVAPSEADATTGDRLSEFSSKSYEITSFSVDKNTVFVISDKGKEANRLAAESLEKPIEAHFLKKKPVETAMLTLFKTDPFK